MDRELLNDISAYVDDVWEDAVSDISRLVSHPSVADAEAAEPGAPFGQPVRAALDEALGIAERLGYQTGEDEGFVGFADIPGEQPEQIATIAHIDVVPAGPGWNTDPFSMERRDGWLLGRGVIDDKGPLVLSLYAGAYLLRRGVRPHYTFRALIGCDEEVGMTDVHHYLERYPQPEFLFTPDAEFPVCNAEKGCFGATFRTAPVAAGRIVSWSGAEATNAIPSESVCELAAEAESLPQPAEHADRIKIEPVGPGRVRITAQGVGGHASMPQGTLNAIALVVDYLQQVAHAVPGFFDAQERAALDLLAQIHADAYGTGIGIACASEAFGPLTCNAGTIQVVDGCIEQSIDVRYPDAISGAEIAHAAQDLAARFGASVQETRDKEPFSVSADHPAVQTLLDIYAQVTGRDAEPFSMGGGTYARNFARAVSFGPEDSSLELPAWAGSMHGPNEAANERQLKDALKMYIMAILRLAAPAEL